MTSKEEEKRLLLRAKKEVRRLKVFYLHLTLYVVVVALIALNFYVMEGPYVSNITALNITVLVLWTAVIGIHAWRVFKGKFLFNKSWEDKKAEQFRKEDEEETTLWE